MVYLLLLVLGLALLVQSYLLVHLLHAQQKLEQRVEHLYRRLSKPKPRPKSCARKAPPTPINGGGNYEERGRR